MLDLKEYSKILIADMCEETRGDKALCELVLPPDLAEHMGEELTLEKMIQRKHHDFELHIDRNILGFSTSYDIKVKSATVKRSYIIKIKNNETDSEELYEYLSSGNKWDDPPYEYKYLITKKNPNGICVMLLFDSSTKKEKSLYAIINYYNNETLEIIGEEKDNFFSLARMKQFEFESDSDKCIDMSFSSLVLAYNYFQELSSELLMCKTLYFRIREGVSYVE